MNDRDFFEFVQKGRVLEDEARKDRAGIVDYIDQVKARAAKKNQTWDQYLREKAKKNARWANALEILERRLNSE